MDKTGLHLLKRTPCTPVHTALKDEDNLCNGEMSLALIVLILTHLDQRN